MILAGDTVDVECEAFDAFGNRTPDENFAVRFQPALAILFAMATPFAWMVLAHFGVACDCPALRLIPRLRCKFERVYRLL